MKKISNVEFENQNLYDKFKEYLECRMCNDFKNEPIACEICYQSFCKLCIGSIMSCPNCSSSQGFFNDNRLRDLIIHLDILIKCKTCNKTYKINDYKEHLKKCKSKKLDQNQVTLYYDKGIELFEKSKFKESLIIFLEIYNGYNIQDIETLLYIAKSYENIGDIIKTEYYYREAVRKENFNYIALSKLGLLKYKQKMFKDSMQYYNLAFADKTFYTDKMKMLGESFRLVEKKYYYKVLKMLKEAESDYISYINMGLILTYFKRNKEAVTYFKSSLAINNKIALTHYNLGLLYMLNKEYHNGGQYLNNAINLDKSFIDIIFKAAQMCKDENDFNQCEQYLKIIYKNNPQHEESKSMLRWINQIKY